jgi:hypothetical protein
VMSQDQTWFGPVAINSGFVYSGWLRCPLPIPTKSTTRSGGSRPLIPTQAVHVDVWSGPRWIRG